MAEAPVTEHVARDRSKSSREGIFETPADRLLINAGPGLEPGRNEGETDGSQRHRQALVAEMPRGSLSRLTLLSALLVTLVFAGSAGIGPI